MTALLSIASMSPPHDLLLQPEPPLLAPGVACPGLRVRVVEQRPHVGPVEMLLVLGGHVPSRLAAPGPTHQSNLTRPASPSPTPNDVQNHPRPAAPSRHSPP